MAGDERRGEEMRGEGGEEGILPPIAGEQVRGEEKRGGERGEKRGHSLQ